MSSLYALLGEVTTTRPNIPWSSFHAFYATNLRASLFSGFITLGSFLVAVNTFIIVNLKKELYDHARYKERVRERQRLAAVNGKGSAVTFYGPLRRLGLMFFVTIMASIFTAIAQLTIGLIPANWAAIACITLAGMTLSLLVTMLVIVRHNLVQWFEFLEADSSSK